VINLTNPFCMGPGTYWVSVQARQDLNPNGQWYWHNRTVQSNAGAAWQNPGDGYGIGCITWNRKNACMPDQVWPDQVFKSSVSLRATHLLQDLDLHHDRALAGRLARSCSSYDLK